MNYSLSSILVFKINHSEKQSFKFCYSRIGIYRNRKYLTSFVNGYESNIIAGYNISPSNDIERPLNRVKI